MEAIRRAGDAMLRYSLLYYKHVMMPPSVIGQKYFHKVASFLTIKGVLAAGVIACIPYFIVHALLPSYVQDLIFSYFKYRTQTGKTEPDEEEEIDISSSHRLRRLDTKQIMDQQETGGTKGNSDAFVARIKRHFFIMEETWNALTADGVKPGIWEVIAFFFIMKKIDNQRAVVRDERYQKDSGVEVTNIREVLEPLVEPAEMVNLVYNEENEFIRSQLANWGFTLLSFEFNPEPGSTSYFVAFSSVRKLAYISIKGSSRLSDCLANLSLGTYPLVLKGPFIEGGDRSVIVHEGFSLVALNIVKEIEEIVKELLLPGRYKIRVVGHSLGGSLACAVGILLRSRMGLHFPQVILPDNDTITVTSFAPNPYTDTATCEKCKSFITCIVNNSDVVPRISTPNLALAISVLQKLRLALEDRNIRPRGFNFFSYVSFFRTLRRRECFWTMEQVRSIVQEGRSKMMTDDDFDYLYLPGRVLIMYDLWVNGKDDCPVEGLRLTDGLCAPLRYLEMDDAGRFLNDHRMEGWCGYLTCIKKLIANEPCKMDEPKVDQAKVVNVAVKKFLQGQSVRLKKEEVDDDDSVISCDSGANSLPTFNSEKKETGQEGSQVHWDVEEVPLTLTGEEFRRLSSSLREFSFRDDIDDF